MVRRRFAAVASLQKQPKYEPLRHHLKYDPLRQRLRDNQQVTEPLRCYILKRFMRIATTLCVDAGPIDFIGMDIVDPAIDFLALATSMGVPACRIDRAAEIAPALETAISSGAPNLIEIPISSS